MNVPLTQPNKDLAEKIRSTIPGMAHWAGTGPKGATCGKCAHFISIARGRGYSTRCQKYSAMMDGHVSAHKLPADTPACRHFAKAGKQRL